MALASSSSDDFGGGIYRGRKAPANSVYDLVNGLIDDTGLPFRRGGSAYYSTSDSAQSLRDLSVLYMRAVSANRVLAKGSTVLYVLDGAKAPVQISTATRLGRPASIGNYAVFAIGTRSLLYYGGSLKGTDYSTGTVTTTGGAAVVTGAGTSWLANADAGMVLIRVVGDGVGVVKSVDSNGQITLMEPWTGTTGAGGSYILSADHNLSLGSLPAIGVRSFVVAAGAGTPRLLMTLGNRVYYTPRGDPFGFSETDYHELPANVNIIGAEGRGDSALIFTTGGVWNIGNLSFDDVDAYGNIQHTVEMVTKDIVVWDDLGIAGWAGGLVIPAIDDVYVASDGFTLAALTERVRPLYRDYVDAGYQAGLATVHRGHYVLPILNGSTWVDTLVCRVDREAAWSRWAGHAGGNAYAVITEEAARTPKLLGISGARVLDLSGAFDPSDSNATDADGSTSDFVLETRDYPTGQHPGFFKTARARYELAPEGEDTFERPNETPLANGWLAWAGSKPNVVDGSAIAPATGAFYDVTRPETIGPNAYVEAIIDGAMAPGSFGLGLRLTAHSAAADGYMFEAQDTGAGTVPALYEGSGFSTLATGSIVPSATVTGLRLTVVGSTITGYLLISGVWTQVVQATDATYSAAGYPGFWVNGAVGLESVAWGSGAPPEVAIAFTSDADAGVFTTLADRGEQGGAAGWGLSAGDKYQWATVGRKRERGRLRITVSGACARFVFRAVELLIRQSGKQ